MRGAHLRAGSGAEIGSVTANGAGDERLVDAPRTSRPALRGTRAPTSHRHPRAADISATRTWSTIAAVAFVSALALLLASAEVRVLQADSYKALYDGRWIAHHGIPHIDYFGGVTRGQRWVDEQWLSELMYYTVWRVGGYSLVAILTAVSIASAYAILAVLIRSRGISPGWTVFFTTGAMFGLVTWAFVRAQDLALPLFAALLVICLGDSKRDRPSARLLLLLPLLAVWANIHGSVLLGTEIAAAYLAWRGIQMARHRSWRLAAGCLGLAGLACLAPLATPYGLDIIHYYRQFADNPGQRVAGAEGRSPAFPGGAFFAVYVPLLLVGWLTIGAAVYRRPAPGFLLVACVLTGIAAAMRIGNMPWHAMVTALLLADVSRTWLPVGRTRRATMAGAFAVSGVATVAVITSLAMRSQAGYEAETALRETNAAAALAAKHACWRILADNLGASALQWHHPWLAGRIAYDARAELLSPSAMMRWAIFQVGTSKGWPATTQGYQLLIGDSGFRPTLVQRLARLPSATVIARHDRGIAVINRDATRADPPGCAR